MSPTISLYYVAGFRKAASRPWFHSGPEALGALAYFFQYRFKTSQFFRARIGEDLLNFGGVFPKDRCDQSFAFWCERHDAAARILGTLDPAYQAPFDEAVNGRTDRAGRKVDLWADRIHRQRPFVEEGFKYPEVGIVDSRLLKPRVKIFRGRVKGLPQYHPTVNRVSRVLVHDETIVPFLYNRCPEACIYINRIDINIHWERGTLQMERKKKKLIAVVGATGQQGGAVVRAL